MRKLLAVLVLMALVVSCAKQEETTEAAGGGSAEQGGGSGGSSSDETRFGRIFSTSTSVNGGQTLTNLDNLCETEADGKGFTGTFKALIGAGSGRRACSTANCSGGPSENSNWVILGLTEFRREDESTVIGTTNASGVFSFPLSSAFGGAVDVWTGLNSDWTGSGASFNCNAWTISNATESANVGDASATDNTSLLTSNETCDNTHPILCVEQVDEPEQEDYRIVFVTDNTYQGGSGLLGAEGIVDFDNVCASEALDKGFIFSTFKAMLTSNDGGNISAADNPRRACYAADCSDQGGNENLDWVFQPNTEYRREDETTVIGTTNSSSIFEFPLDNSFTGVNETYWTGFPSTWAILNTGGGNIDCLGWTSKDGGASGRVGVGDETDSNAIDRTSGQASCSTSHKIICVEQTR